MHTLFSCRYNMDTNQVEARFAEIRNGNDLSSELIIHPKSDTIGRKQGRWTRGASMRSFDYCRLANRTWGTDVF